ncbi:DUF2267 domain-containing protein [Streptomyces iconiensis]|uniref:DUF2267 domain-containing protein n=1 Tax=Streptomyces iconiensis TaxID=1384038 RepID=A0ABT6ZZ86_9ACTN|nr:DUF2267 domain-containing protein [Streptomyces iconiensis]MDJ1134380.1 DUF2267 domain-containing protein [Streptomyces iconiensis]
MTYGEFLAGVRERGGYPDREEALRVTEAVVVLLGTRLQENSARHLASQLPAELTEALTHDSGGASTWSEGEFLTRVGEATGAENEAVARKHAEAVCHTVKDTISGGELNKLISQLPSGYAPLFGYPELT